MRFNSEAQWTIRVMMIVFASAFVIALLVLDLFGVLVPRLMGREESFISELSNPLLLGIALAGYFSLDCLIGFLASRPRCRT